MNSDEQLADAILSTWKTGNRVTIYLIENLPLELWPMNVPGYSQKTIQMIGGHLHNTRCMWIKNAGEKFGVSIPESVDRYRVSQKKLIKALGKSSSAILRLIRKGIEDGGSLPGFSMDTVHFMTYLVAHEAHHRGQIIMAARQLDHQLPDEVTYGVWKWSKRGKEL